MGKPTAVDVSTELTQRWTEDHVKTTVPDWIRNGTMLEGVAVTAATVDVAHKLGRVPKGWVVTYRSADAQVWQTAATDKLLTLDSSANVIVNLWVF